MQKQVWILLGIIFLIFPITMIEAEEEPQSWQFVLEDPIGDDYGPGSYRYPNSEIFNNQEGLFDLHEFKIRETSKKQVLSFKFGQLIDPWNSKYGFSLPLIQLYIDNDEGGNNQLFQEGANIRFDSDFAWNRFFKLSGWWLRVYRPEDDAEEIIDFNTDIRDNPREIKDANITTKENIIEVEIDRDILGSLKESDIYLLVGGFDPFGPDHYRDIDAEPSNWEFHDTSDQNLKYAPRVIDLLVPEGKDQSKILSEYSENYPLIESVRLGASKNKYSLIFSRNSYFILLILLAGLALYLQQKGVFKSNN